MKQAWFETWFNTPYYHQLYCHRDEQEAELFIEKLVLFLQLKQNEKVLDMGCGKGRHARFLHQLGLNVVGVDLSEQSIACAKLAEQETLQFFVGDIRSVFKKEEFDIVTNDKVCRNNFAITTNYPATSFTWSILDALGNARQVSETTS